MLAYLKRLLFSVGVNGRNTHRVITVLGIKIKIRIRHKDMEICSRTIVDFSKFKSVEDNERCSGCSACASICPNDAISMKENDEGFLVPVLDKSKCVNCGACNRVCPVINFTVKGLKRQRCFAAQADDDLRKESSSGGMFSLLAHQIIDAGGYVCGAVYSDDCRDVFHIVSNCRADIARMRVSKYVQSDLRDTFREIKSLLGDNKKCMFVGCPCQVAGLKAYLGCSNENLLLVDLICCGVPSRKVYRKFLDEETLTLGAPVSNVKFRMKDKGWYSCAVEIKGGANTHRIPNEKCIYEQCHFTGLSTGRLCEVCPFDSFSREGDVSIGDFWHIGVVKPDLDDDKGTSCVLVNSPVGEYWISCARVNMRLFKKVPAKLIIPGNENIINPIRHLNRRHFFYNLGKKCLRDNYIDCLTDKADCIVFNNALTEINYGSMLTAYAIQEVLIELGFYAKILNHARVPMPKYKGSFAERFAIEYLNLTAPVNTEKDFLGLNSKTNVFMVGSDQMWRTKYWKEKVDKILLDFAERSKRKIACSISFGMDEFDGTEDEKRHFKESLKSFKAISVREDSGVAICRQEFDSDATWILDPVFILNPQRWQSMSKLSDIDFSGSLVYYGWDTSPTLNGKLERIAHQNGCSDVKNITFMKYDVESWLAAIKTAKLVVTDSFHGLCFSMIFRKKFVCVSWLGEGRFNSLCHRFHIDEWIVSRLEDVGVIREIDYDMIEKMINEDRVRSLAFLRSTLSDS